MYIGQLCCDAEDMVLYGQSTAFHSSLLLFIRLYFLVSEKKLPSRKTVTLTVK